MVLAKVSSNVMSPRLIRFSMALGALMTSTFGFLSILYPQIAFVHLSYRDVFGGFTPFGLGPPGSNDNLAYSNVGFFTSGVGGILVLTSLTTGIKKGKILALVGILLEIIGLPISLVGIHFNLYRITTPEYHETFVPWIGTWLMLAGVLLSFISAMLKFQRTFRQLIFITPLLILLGTNIWFPLLLIFDLKSASAMFHSMWGTWLSLSFGFLGVFGWFLAIGQIHSCSTDIKKASKNLGYG